jgi:hypothetical protein
LGEGFRAIFAVELVAALEEIDPMRVGFIPEVGGDASDGDGADVLPQPSK